MTIFAGIVARRADGTIPEDARAQLRAVVSRRPGDVVAEIAGAASHLVQVDLGAFRVPPVHRDADGRVSMWSGEPLPWRDHDSGDRNDLHGIGALHDDLTHGDLRGLARCSGTFCAVQVDPVAGRVTLVSDRVGVRPLYVWIGPRITVFATALRILEALDCVPKIRDLRGVAEIACFGFPLADRTTYADVQMLREAQIVRIDPTRVQRDTYYRWADVSRRDAPDDAPARAGERFATAVGRRLGTDRTAAVLLSGGLDSRSVAGVLRARGIEVHSLNLASPGAQDCEFAARAAAALGTRHAQLPAPESSTRPADWRPWARAWLDSQIVAQTPPDRRGVVWTGDGGSVGLGHVLMNDMMVRLMDQGAVRAAALELLRFNRWHLPRGVFRGGVRERMATLPLDGVVEELERLQCEDPGRALHLFLMFNHERRHMVRHFEGLDLHRIEYQFPFLDGDFLECVLALPVATCLRHGFYMDWLAGFPAAVTAVPWQTYPGHLPCPLPAPTGLGYQWNRERGRARRRTLRRSAMRFLMELWRNRRVADEMFSGPRLVGAAVASTIGVRDYEYVFEVVRVFRAHRAARR